MRFNLGPINISITIDPYKGFIVPQDFSEDEKLTLRKIRVRQVRLMSGRLLSQIRKIREDTGLPLSRAKKVWDLNVYGNGIFNPDLNI